MPETMKIPYNTWGISTYSTTPTRVDNPYNSNWNCYLKTF